MKRQIVIGALVVFLSTVGGFAVSFARIGDITHEQYYRGAYDVCLMFAERVFSQPAERAISSCLRSIASAQDIDWYSQESIGYEWPLPTYEGK